MKTNALRFLVCPGCKGDLEVSAESTSGSEVLTGWLFCHECRRSYPIQRGVPRFVDAGRYASTFGYQWNRFPTTQLDSVSGTRESEELLEAASGWTARDLRDRLVLDAGVGAGRYAEVVAAKDGEVVGVDLTSAVDAAYANLGQHPRVHLVQADIFSMPFRNGTFDLAYSIGVLHHTPDPREAFACIARAVKKGGGLAVYLYGAYGIARHFSNFIRKATTRLPLKVMLVLATAAVPLYYLYRLPVVGWIPRIVCPISMHPSWRSRWLDTFDWYTPFYQWHLQYPEVSRWFRANGFTDLEIFDGPIRMRGIKTEES